MIIIITNNINVFTLARSNGRDDMILNAVGRLSSLNRLIATDGPIGGNGRSDGFNIGGSCGAITAVDLDLCGTTDSADLLSLPITSAPGEDKMVSAFVVSATITTFCFFATCSVSISPF